MTVTIVIYDNICAGLLSQAPKKATTLLIRGIDNDARSDDGAAKNKSLVAETTLAPRRDRKRSKVISTNLRVESDKFVHHLSTSTRAPSTASTKTSSLSTTTTEKTTTAEGKGGTFEEHNMLPDARIDGCFERIDGYAMNNTAGGLERDVSIEECACFCAYSLCVSFLFIPY